MSISIKSGMQTSPVFLVGPVRSGSTFLRLMLDSHPDIINPGECDFLFDLVDDTGCLPNVAEYCKWLAINRIFLAKKLKVSSELSYGDLMDSFIQQFNKDHQQLVMNVHRHFNRIAFIFPDARYIHLLRDPRDVARSCIGMGWVGHVYYGVDIWQESELSWDRLRGGLRLEQYLEIKYEDLLNNIDEVLSQICDFLGVGYSVDMLSYADHSNYAKPDKSLRYQWKHKYSIRELQLVEGKVGEMLVNRQYELSGYSSAKPGVWEAFKLNLQNKFYRIRYALGRYGIGLYVLSQVSSRLGLHSVFAMCQKKKNKIDERHLK